MPSPLDLRITLLDSDIEPSLHSWLTSSFFLTSLIYILGFDSLFLEDFCFSESGVGSHLHFLTFSCMDLKPHPLIGQHNSCSVFYSHVDILWNFGRGQLQNQTCFSDIYISFLCVCVRGGVTEYWPQGLMLARQFLPHWAIHLALYWILIYVSSSSDFDTVLSVHSVSLVFSSLLIHRCPSDLIFIVFAAFIHKSLPWVANWKVPVILVWPMNLHF